MVDEALKRLLESYEVGELLSRRILLVDDEVENLDVLAGVLESDYEVHQARSGAGALEVVARAPIDVIIADQRMPGMTGVDLLERVRRSQPDIAGIVLTAYTDSPAIIAAINRAGAFRFLTKPWQPDDIRLVVSLASQHVYHRRAIHRLVELVARRNEELAEALEDLRATQARMIHLERLGTMGRLTAGITHDLKSLLMGLVLTENELAVEPRGLDTSGSNMVDDVRETVAVVAAGARNLIDTLQALNQFARGGQLQITATTVAPETIVRDALTVTRMDLEFRRRNQVVRIQPDLPSIRGDRRRLTQVLVNLIRNAVQATEWRQTVTVEASTGLNGEVVLAVEDEGPGVAPELRDKLFEPFVTSKGEDGMGMGLYMARLIVESHGGRLTCRDRPDGGMRFEVTM